MSSTAVGRIRVDGTTPSALPYNLLTAPGVLQSGVGRWDGGVNLWGFTPDVPSTWDACSSGTFRSKDDGEQVGFEPFDSFVIYVAQNCSTFGTATDLPGFIRRAQSVLDATQAFALEHALAQGVDGLSNKYLGDADLDILGGGPVKPEVAIAYLEDAIGATGRSGLIHLTPSVAGYLGFNLLREVDPDRVPNNDDEYLVTAAGTPVVVGGGYIGTDPDLGTSPAAGQSWAFATGPIQVRLSELLAGPEEIHGLVDPEFNEVIYRAEKLANVSWDGELQAGVLVDWTP